MRMMKTTEERNLIDIMDLMREVNRLDDRKLRETVWSILKRIDKFKFIRTKYGMNFYRDKRGVKA